MKFILGMVLGASVLLGSMSLNENARDKAFSIAYETENLVRDNAHYLEDAKEYISEKVNDLI